MMPNNAVFTIRQFDITLPTLGTPFHIIPVGDIHYNAPGHDRERFREFLAHCRKEHKRHTYYLFMGDEHETASESERAQLDRAKLHESTVENLDKMALASCKSLRDDLAFMRGTIIGMIQGNHYWSFNKTSQEDGVQAGETSTQWMAKALGTQWCGYLTYVRLRVHAQGQHTRLDIVASHGKAGGKLVGTTINQVEDLRKIFPGADIYAMGHDHSRGAWPVSSLWVPKDVCGDGEASLKQKRQWLCRTGSFLKGYVPNEQNYIVRGLLRPSELGIIKLEVKLHRPHGRGESRPIVTDIHCWS